MDTTKDLLRLFALHMTDMGRLAVLQLRLTILMSQDMQPTIRGLAKARKGVGRNSSSNIITIVIMEASPDHDQSRAKSTRVDHQRSLT